MLETSLLAGRVRLLELPRFQDNRGLLVPITFGNELFQVVRAFIICGSPGAVRGGHAHRRSRQILMLLQGRVDVELVDSSERATVSLERSGAALLIETGIWSRQYYGDQGASMVVFSDTLYDPADYVDQS